MSEKFYVGLDVTGISDKGKRPAVSSVTFQLDADNTITAGSFTGTDLYAICPYATQEMALAILLEVLDYRYQAFQADGANIDPAAELGDGIDAGGIYGVISAIEDNGSGYPGIVAPGEEELEDEYPYRSAASRDLSNDVNSLRAFITKSLGGMQIELTSMKGTLDLITQKLDDISNKVTELDSRVSALEGGH